MDYNKRQPHRCKKVRSHQVNFVTVLICQVEVNRINAATVKQRKSAMAFMR